MAENLITLHHIGRKNPATTERTLRHLGHLFARGFNPKRLFHLRRTPIMEGAAAAVHKQIVFIQTSADTEPAYNFPVIFAI